MMTPGIQMLEVSSGTEDSLMVAGFTSLESLLRSTHAEIAAVLGSELCVAKLIIEVAKNAAGQANEISYEID